MRTLVTCEHGGHRVPPVYRCLFTGAEEVLAGHRGWDPGALPLAQRLAAALGCPLVAATVTRLLVDLNRSQDHPQVFSEYTLPLPPEERAHLLAERWRPYRETVERTIAAGVQAGETVLHLSIHTFTPVWEGHRRQVDVGLLFDPTRGPETAWCRTLRTRLQTRRPDLQVRDNEPYQGVDDGLTTHLRTRFDPDRYLGVELEVNQRFPQGAPEEWERLQEEIVEEIGR